MSCFDRWRMQVTSSFTMFDVQPAAVVAGTPRTSCVVGMLLDTTDLPTSDLPTNADLPGGTELVQNPWDNSTQVPFLSVTLSASPPLGVCMPVRWHLTHVTHAHTARHRYCCVHRPSLDTMEEYTRRRRRPRALSAILAAALACSHSSGSASAFVPPAGPLHSPFSSATAVAEAAVAPTRSGVPAAGRPSQQQHLSQRRRELLQARAPRRSSSFSSPLAGAVPAGGVAPTDHTDGWEPRDGVEIGTCSLVGSGPGDPDLLTVAGLRELQSADLVIADRLVSKEILGLVSFCFALRGGNVNPAAVGRMQLPHNCQAAET